MEPSPGRPESPDQPSDDSRTRRVLAIAVTALVSAVAILAIVVPGAHPIFKELLPILTLVLGYFFGQTQRAR